MYYRHFKLSGSPFQFTPSTTALYLGEPHRECLAAMEWVLLHEPCPLMLLLGETGTGKTTLLNAIVARQFANLRLACVANPKLNFEEIMVVVLAQLGTTTTERGRLGLIRALESTYGNQPAGHRTAIVIDEAQDLSDETLEDLRLLTNEIGSNRMGIQFILMGQPELLDRLSAPRLRQFRERVGVKVSLTPLSEKECAEYVEYRLQAVGGSAELFDKKALREIVAASGGIPRRLNILCHNALLVAYVESANKVTLRIASDVIKDYASIFHPSVHTQVEPLCSEAPKMDRGRHFLVSAAEALGALCLLGISGFLLASKYPVRHVASAVGEHLIAAAVQIPYERPAPTAQVAQQVREVSPKTEGEAEVQSGVSAIASHGVSTGAATSMTSISSDESSPVSGLTKIQIRAGDTFHDLAARYLGSVDRTWELIKANPQIRNPSVIYPGETIYVPSVQKVADQEYSGE